MARKATWHVIAGKKRRVARVRIPKRQENVSADRMANGIVGLGREFIPGT